MFVIVAQYWMWFAAAFLFGVVVGLIAWRRGERLMSNWLTWAFGLFVIGVCVAIFRLLQGRAGWHLESALTFFASYIVGCFVGDALHALFAAPQKAFPEPARAGAAPAHVFPTIGVNAPLALDTSAAYPGVRPAALMMSKGQQDDLTLINGVKPIDAKLLNDLGVFHFRQIADWTPPNARWIDHHFAQTGRVKAENWIAQAGALAKGGALAAGAAASKAAADKAAADKAAADKAAADKAAADKAAAERAAAEKAAADKAAADKAAADRAAAEKAAADKAAADKAAADKAAADKAAAEKAAAERAAAAASVAAAGVAAGVASAGSAPVAAAKADPFTFGVSRSGDRITLSGHAPSQDAREGIVSAARSAFGGAHVVDAMTVASGAPVGFEAAALHGLRQCATLDEPKLTLTGRTYNLSGAARDAAGYDAALAGAKGLPGEMYAGAIAIAGPRMRPYGWSVRKEHGRITLEGGAPDASARAQLGVEAARLNPGANVDNRLTIASGAPVDYLSGAKFALMQLGGLKSGSFAVSDGALSAAGEAKDAQAGRALGDRLRGVIPGGLRLARNDVRWDEPAPAAPVTAPAAVAAPAPAAAPAAESAAAPAASVAPVSGHYPGAQPAALAAPRGGKADDLKRVRGIGRQNEARLHGLGIWHFDQIAAWTRAEIEWVGSYLAFPGRIEREEWVRQAKVLAAGQETEFSRRVDQGLVETSKGGPTPKPE